MLFPIIFTRADYLMIFWSRIAEILILMARVQYKPMLDKLQKLSKKLKITAFVVRNSWPATKLFFVFITAAFNSSSEPSIQSE